MGRSTLWRAWVRRGGAVRLSVERFAGDRPDHVSPCRGMNGRRILGDRPMPATSCQFTIGIRGLLRAIGIMTRRKRCCVANQKIDGSTGVQIDGRLIDRQLSVAHRVWRSEQFDKTIWLQTCCSSMACFNGQDWVTMDRDRWGDRGGGRWGQLRRPKCFRKNFAKSL